MLLRAPILISHNPRWSGKTCHSRLHRKLKHHEQKLLKKVDQVEWRSDEKHRDVAVMRRYHLQKREDYSKYNKLCGDLQHLAHRLSRLDPQDPFRRRHEEQLLEKLHGMGLLNTTAAFSDLENKLSVSAICRRRLPIIMTRLKMCETVPTATKYIEQGHVRVGPEVVTDPAFLVTR